MFFILLAALESEEERIKIQSIYDRCKHTCEMAAYGITRNHELAEDAVEDAFVDIIRHKEKYLSKSYEEIRNLVITVTKCRAVDIVRKRSNHPEFSTEDDDFDKICDESAEDVFFNAYDYEKMLSALASLDETHKSVLELKFVANMSNDEISEQLNITKKNVEIRLYRARVKLKIILESEMRSHA